MCLVCIYVLVIISVSDPVDDAYIYTNIHIVLIINPCTSREKTKRERESVCVCVYICVFSIYIYIC